MSERQILRDLERSILFAPGFPKRIRATVAEFGAMSNFERGALSEPSIEAIARARNHAPALEAMVRRLGTARYEPAVPTLSRLWRECALASVWAEAGHALLDISTPEAWDALEAALEDSDALARTLAVRAAFARDVRRAYDLLAPRFANPRADAVCVSVLEVLAPRFTLGVGPICLDGGLNVLGRDVRWRDLCRKLRRHEHYGALARSALQHAGAEECGISR